MLSFCRAFPFWLGLVLDREGDEQSAEVCYQRAIELNPKLAQIYLNLGVLMVSMKREDEAEVCYRTAMRLEKPMPWLASI